MIPLKLFLMFSVTEDSGRTSNTIGIRPRKLINVQLKEEIDNSKFYHLICDKFSYSIILILKEVIRYGFGNI
jgi:hypothetical protein